MVAMIVAMLVSQLRYRHISPLLWFSGVMVRGARRAHHLAARRDLHQDQADHLLQRRRRPAAVRPARPAATCSRWCSAPLYPGLSDRGWQLLTRNWVDLLHRHGGRSTRRSGARPAPTSGSRFKFWVFLPVDLPVRARQRADADAARLAAARNRRKSRRSRRRNEGGSDAAGHLDQGAEQDLCVGPAGAEAARPRHRSAARSSRCSAPTAPARRR